MHNDFEPVHLIEANAKLQKHKLASARDQKNEDTSVDDSGQTSLWKKFVNLFKPKPFELPGEY